MLLALSETSLSWQVGRGENSGRLLRHAAVVRALRPLGSVGPNGIFATTAPLTLSAGWKTQNLQAVVMVQASRHIVGVASLTFNDLSTSAPNLAPD